MARVLHLFRAPKKRLPMEELPDVPVITNAGFQGCTHARPRGKRQILLVDWETLEAMNLQPGIIRENITTEGLNVNGLRTGEQLQIGDVRLGSERGMHAVRSTRKSASRTSKRNLGQARHAVPSYLWGNLASRRCD
jgi:hypothetical protein